MKVKVLDLREGMILKNAVFSSGLVLMDRGQKLTEKHIESLKKYNIHEVDIVSEKEIKLREVKEQEKKIKEEFKKVYIETVEKPKIKIFSKTGQGIKEALYNRKINKVIREEKRAAKKSRSQQREVKEIQKKQAENSEKQISKDLKE